jgi:hypothetical protein
VELKDFIKEAIENIVEGVVAAQETIKDKGAQINPRKVQFRENGQWNNHNSGMPRFVEFDVGLTSANKSGSTEGIGVFLGSISLGKKNNEGAEHTAVTRIKFSVPLVLPSGDGEFLD